MAATPSTAVEMTPFQAAAEMRMLIREIVTRSPGKTFLYTDTVIKRIEKATNATYIKTTEIPLLKENLRVERNTQRITEEEIQRLYTLVQQLPTKEDLPKATPAESILRAIEALIKNVKLEAANGNQAS